MMRSYLNDRTLVPCLLALVAASAAAQSPAATAAATGPSVRLQIRVFDGTDDVTRDAHVRLYAAGHRSDPVALTLGPDQAYEADVPVGVYDVQAIRERAGAAAGVRWVERLLVHRYPDEFGRPQQVVNLRSGFGALQIRPGAGTTGPAGWSAVATPPGARATEVARAKPCGADLVLVVPSGTYDVKVMVPNGDPTWIANLDIPDGRTRLKAWPFKP
jgi:hypothetical protein